MLLKAGMSFCIEKNEIRSNTLGEYENKQISDVCEKNVCLKQAGFSSTKLSYISFLQLYDIVPDR